MASKESKSDEYETMSLEQLVDEMDFLQKEMAAAVASQEFGKLAPMTAPMSDKVKRIKKLLEEKKSSASGDDGSNKTNVAKFTLAELKAADFSTAKCMNLPGVFRSDLERAGFNVDEMKAHDKALYDEIWDDKKDAEGPCRPKEVGRLVELGAIGSGYKNPSNGITALYYATYSNKPKCVKIMLSTMSKDDAAVQRKSGDTALSYAAYAGYAECVELLLQHMDRGGVMVKTDGGMTAKEWAQEKGHTQCVALFTKYGY